MPLTILIPCKDERANIVPCILSARQVADEILVADSGSTDGTMDEAKRLGCRVIEREYVNSGDFKNWSIPQAPHDWVLIVDADERVTPELADEIRELLAGRPEHDAYYVRRSNYFLGHAVRHGDWARDRVIRLLRRDRCRYSCHTDHAEIDVSSPRLGRLQHPLVHFTAWDLQDYMRKMSHYANQQADLWLASGKRPSLLKLLVNGPLRFFRGYVLRGGFRDGAIGFQLAMMTGYYSFLKQAMFWQRVRGRTHGELEPAHTVAEASSTPSTSICDSTAEKSAA